MVVLHIYLPLFYLVFPMVNNILAEKYCNWRVFS